MPSVTILFSAMHRITGVFSFESRPHSLYSFTSTNIYIRPTRPDATRPDPTQPNATNTQIYNGAVLLSALATHLAQHAYAPEAAAALTFAVLGVEACLPLSSIRYLGLRYVSEMGWDGDGDGGGGNHGTEKIIANM